MQNVQIVGVPPGGDPARPVAVPINANLSLPGGPSTKELASLSAGSLNADLLPATDVSAYRGATVQINGTWAGTLTAQISNDGVNWFSAFWFDLATPFNVITSTLTTTGHLMNIAMTGYRYLRIRFTAYTSGTATAVVELSSAQPDMPTEFVILSSNASSAVGAVMLTPTAGLGSTAPFRTLDANATGAVIKASTGVLIGFAASNTNAAARFLKIYNQATIPTSGNTPEATYLLPPNSVTVFNPPYPQRKTSGIGYRVTTGAPDADTGAPTANDVILNLDFA